MLIPMQYMRLRGSDEPDKVGGRGIGPGQMTMNLREHARKLD